MLRGFEVPVSSPGFDALLRRAGRGEPEALGAIFDAYHRRVYGLLLRMTGSRDAAEELLQETFLRVVGTIERYEHDGRFDAWLFRIAGNLARDHNRRRRRRGTTLSSDGFDADADDARSTPPASDEESPLRALESTECHERLQRCLDALPESDREMLVLRHFSELPFRDIADMLGMPLGTALARAHRALGRLRAEWDALDNPDPRASEPENERRIARRARGDQSKGRLT